MAPVLLCGLLELFKEAIDFFSVEDDAGTLVHCDQQRAPLFVEGAPLHADIVDRFGVVESSLHADRLRNLRLISLASLLLIASISKGRHMKLHEPRDESLTRFG